MSSFSRHGGHGGHGGHGDWRRGRNWDRGYGLGGLYGGYGLGLGLESLALASAVANAPLYSSPLGLGINSFATPLAAEYAYGGLGVPLGLPIRSYPFFPRRFY